MDRSRVRELKSTASRENFYTTKDECRRGSQSSESDFEYITEHSLIKAPSRSSSRHSVPCSNDCGEILDSSNLESHITNDCPLTIIDCDFQHVGCEVRLPRKDMPAHLQKSVASHLSLQTTNYQEQLKALKTENKTLAKRYEKLEEKYKQLERSVNELMFDKLAKVSTCAVPRAGSARHSKVKRKFSLDVGTESQDNANRLQLRPIPKPRPISPRPHIKPRTKVRKKSAPTKKQETVEPYVDDGEYMNANEYPGAEERGIEDEEYSYVFTNDLEPPRSPLSKAPLQSPTNLVMRNFERHKKNEDHWMSQPFFTHSQGYMMSLRVTANGQGSGKGTHITVGVYLMKGEFDDQLEWPFRGDITIQLLNQEGESEHFTKIIHGAEGEKIETKIGEKFISAWGVTQFKSHSELSPKYIKNDSLKFKIVVSVLKKSKNTSPIIQTEV